MIKRALFFFMVFFLMSQSVYAADNVTQKVGLVLDGRSPGYRIELIIQKVVLSVSSNSSEVRVYSADKSDLEYAGVTELNGKVLLKAVKKTGYYQVQLYTADKEKENILFDDTIRLNLNRFGDTVDDVARQVIAAIAKKYPPKPVQELTTINLVKVKLSEYESQDGYWSLAVTPVFQLLKPAITIQDMLHNNMEYEKQFDSMGAMMKVEGTYRIQQWNFSISASAGGGAYSPTDNTAKGYYYNYYLHGMVGYGIFGSLIILGLEPHLYLCQWLNNFDYNINGSVICAPDYYIRMIQFSLYLQVNITKDYYIVLSGTPPLSFDYLNSVFLDFNKNGKYPYLTNVTVASKYSTGTPLIRVLFNFRLLQAWNIQVYYDTLRLNFNADMDAKDNLKKPLMVYPANQIFMSGFALESTRIGLGINHEF